MNQIGVTPRNMESVSMSLNSTLGFTCCAGSVDNPGDIIRCDCDVQVFRVPRGDIDFVGG